MTIRPSRSERENEPPKSPTACFWKRLANQCTDMPFMGKVNPPFGPWKERMTMVESGP